MDAINNFLVQLNAYIGNKSAWFPYVLLGTGIFFTLYLKFPQIRFFRHAFRIVTGRWEKKEFKGDTTHFQSLATALSGTVGTGNIGGVGLALWIGGPAALFWLWATAFFGMTLKFVEVTLSHKYRNIEKDGSIAGGPMYYMENKLRMKWLATIFAFATIVCSFGTGNLPQINNIARTAEKVFHLPLWGVGGFLSFLLFLIIIGGIKRIAKVTEKIVPLMGIIYVVGALFVIIANYTNIIPSFRDIFVHVFTGSAAFGGFVGASFAMAFRQGTGQGIFSNEAGQGSAAIAHSAAKADEPVSEGMVSILEPFFDTLVICTLTGLTVLASGAWKQKADNIIFQRADMEIVKERYVGKNPEHVRMLFDHFDHKKGDQVAPFTGELPLTDGRIEESAHVTVIHARSIAENMIFLKGGAPVTGSLTVTNGKLDDTGVVVKGTSRIHSAMLTAEAFKKGFLGDKGEYIVSIGLFLFAFSTVISWSYYGDRATTYLFGLRYVIPYRLFYIAMFFMGALLDTTVVWNFANIAIVLMAVPNLFGILVLYKDMKQSIVDYWDKFKREHPEDAKRLKIR